MLFLELLLGLLFLKIILIPKGGVFCSPTVSRRGSAEVWSKRNDGTKSQRSCEVGIGDDGKCGPLKGIESSPWKEWGLGEMKPRLL